MSPARPSTGPSLRTLYDQGIAAAAPRASLATIDAGSAVTLDRADDQPVRTRAEIVAQAAYTLVAQAGADQRARAIVGDLSGSAKA